jgi:hypothetical protein
MTEVTPIGLPSVQVALNKAKTAIGAVKKSERNSAQGFLFRGVDAVVTAAAPALNDNGIIVAPELVSYTYETVEVGRNKTAMGHVMVTVAYRFYGPAGDFVTSTVLAESMDSGDKAAAKAMSVAFRIALLQTLNLPTDEPDPDLDSYERSGVPAGNTESAKTVKTAKTAADGGNPDWVKSIAGVKTVEALRNTWKSAGAAGALNELVITPDGEKMTVQDLLYKRNDELSFSKSPGSPEPAPVA